MLTETEKSFEESPEELAAPLPMRKDLPEDQRAPQITDTRDIHKTTGGKIADFFIYYVLGFFANSALSLGITYGINPRPEVKTAKDSITKSLTKVFGKAHPEKVYDNVRSGLEIAFMTCAGFIMTGVMTPLVKNRDKVAYKINQMLGKDTDILPHHLQTPPEPRTIEDKLEQEINKRVEKRINAADLWKSRIVSLVGVFVGDQLLNSFNRKREMAGKSSIDTLAWQGGQKLYGVLPKDKVSGMNKWFTEHGAGINDIKENMQDHFNRLEGMERKLVGSGALNEDRLVVTEQARLVSKEVGWTLILATFVDKLTGQFKKSRVEREKEKAIASITKEGLVPEGHKIVMEGDHVRLEATSIPTLTEKTSSIDEKKTQWANNVLPRTQPQSFESNTQSVTTRRLENQSLGLGGT